MVDDTSLIGDAKETTDKQRTANKTKTKESLEAIIKSQKLRIGKICSGIIGRDKKKKKKINKYFFNLNFFFIF